MDRSGLPGPRANLELVAAAADVVPEARLRQWASLGPTDAPAGTATEFLPVCGAVGLGRLMVESADDAPRRGAILATLRDLARDPRWRVREGVAMALQRWGVAEMDALLPAMRSWATSGDRLVQRAVVAGLCEPPLLHDAANAAEVVAILDRLTATLVAADDRRTDSYRVLRQALGYGWSVSIVAAPEPGRAAFERWAADGDPDIRWIVRENLGKHRLQRLDAAWVERLAGQAGRSVPSRS